MLEQAISALPYSIFHSFSLLSYSENIVPAFSVYKLAGWIL
jgi:hypothetical protein